MGEISRIFERIQSERLIFIADSCYSGASGGRTIKIAEIRANISDAFLDRIAAGRGKRIISHHYLSFIRLINGVETLLVHYIFLRHKSK